MTQTNQPQSPGNSATPTPVKTYAVEYATYNSVRTIGAVNNAPTADAALALFCEVNDIKRRGDGMVGRTGMLSARVISERGTPVEPAEVIVKSLRGGNDRREEMTARFGVGRQLVIQPLPGNIKLTVAPIVNHDERDTMTQTNQPQSPGNSATYAKGAEVHGKDRGGDWAFGSGDWGIVIEDQGEDVLVAMYGDESSTRLLSKSDIKLAR